ncbi:MAG: amidohydrolase [Chloroflexi bacterium]|nr:amidohydrolase [Chloroflexota bacterium]
MIIDFHTHIFPPNVVEKREEYQRRDPLFDTLYSNPRAKLVGADELVAAMDQWGIHKAVVLNIGWVSHQLCLETNDYIMEAVARYPDRLIGFGAIQPRAGEAALIEMERCAKGGLRGIGELRPDAQGYDLREVALMAPLVEAAMNHGLILLTHASEPVGHDYPGKGTVTPDALYRFVTSFPHVDIVCAHWGGGLPFYALMPEVAQALAQAHFDTAAWPFIYKDDIFRHLIDILGAHQILFGSDYPLLDQGRLIKTLRSLDLDLETQDLILGGNAARLLKIEAEEGERGISSRK